MTSASKFKLWLMYQLHLKYTGFSFKPQSLRTLIKCYLLDFIHLINNLLLYYIKILLTAIS